MQRKQQFFSEKQMLPVVDQRGCAYMHNAPMSPFFGGTLSHPIENPWTPFHGVSFQPSESCPRNFIIYDQTDKQSQIMYHPAITPQQLCFTGQNAGFPFKDVGKTHGVNVEREISSFKEDSDDIDALLSYDEDEEEESDDDEVSSARTQGNYICDLSDSWSSNSSRAQKGKVPSFSHDSVGGGSTSSGLKRQKMRKMVKTLRKIVPGGNEMNAVAVLDEAVKYLKTLKVEVQNLGLGNLKTGALSGRECFNFLIGKMYVTFHLSLFRKIPLYGALHLGVLQELPPYASLFASVCVGYILMFLFGAKVRS